VKDELAALRLLAFVDEIERELHEAGRAAVLVAEQLRRDVALACVAICLAVQALFLRFGQGDKSIFDPVGDNTYGIYVVHYIFVLWLQYALLDVSSLTAIPKALIVFVGTLLLSWGVTIALRRIPGARRVL
jgi:surface polysaccharide O-acyltransferase-like enzyme